MLSSKACLKAQTRPVIITSDYNLCNHYLSIRRQQYCQTKYLLFSKLKKSNQKKSDCLTLDGSASTDSFRQTDVDNNMLIIPVLSGGDRAHSGRQTSPVLGAAEDQAGAPPSSLFSPLAAPARLSAAAAAAAAASGNHAGPFSVSSVPAEPGGITAALLPDS